MCNNIYTLLLKWGTYPLMLCWYIYLLLVTQGSAFLSSVGGRLEISHLLLDLFRWYHLSHGNLLVYFCSLYCCLSLHYSSLEKLYYNADTCCNVGVLTVHSVWWWRGWAWCIPSANTVWIALHSFKVYVHNSFIHKGLQAIVSPCNIDMGLAWFLNDMPTISQGVTSFCLWDGMFFFQATYYPSDLSNGSTCICFRVWDRMGYRTEIEIVWVTGSKWR